MANPTVHDLSTILSLKPIDLGRSPVLSSDLSIPKPLSSLDFEFFYQGLREHKLLVQQCDRCGKIRNPPGPICPSCRSLEWTPFECSGRGQVHSYTIHHHPPLPGFIMPHAMVLVDMDEGFRLLGSFARSCDIEIGAEVSIEFMQCGETATYQFKPASQCRRRPQANWDEPADELGRELKDDPG